MYESGANPKYERVEQLQESDITFLQRLCKNAGISLKATNKRLVLFDEASTKRKRPSRPSSAASVDTGSTSCGLARQTSSTRPAA
jgi:phage protein D